MPDLFDDHAYPNPRAMLRMTHRYDTWPRTGSPKIFFGEWATRDGQRIPTGNVNDMLADAAWLSGLERNSDVVTHRLLRTAARQRKPQRPRMGHQPHRLRRPQQLRLPRPTTCKKCTPKIAAMSSSPPISLSPRPDPASIPAAHGSIGVGTWATTSEYKDIKVTTGRQNPLPIRFLRRIHGQLDPLRRRSRSRNTWSIVDGACHQTGNGQGIFNTAGDTAWTDYTVSLKARKIEGSEGFLVLVHYQDRNNVTWWNVGGWNNTATGLEQTSDGNKTTIGQTAPVTIDPNTWYDLRVEVTGRDIKCYLDDKLVNEATEAPPHPPAPSSPKPPAKIPPARSS